MRYTRLFTPLFRMISRFWLRKKVAITLGAGRPVLFNPLMASVIFSLNPSFAMSQRSSGISSARKAGYFRGAGLVQTLVSVLSPSKALSRRDIAPCRTTT